MTPLEAGECSDPTKDGLKKDTGIVSGRLSRWLEELYSRFNHREYVHPDPVALLYGFEDVREREIAALVAASLAYGRAAQIMKSAGMVLDALGPSPRKFVLNSSDEDLLARLRSFRHRFTSGEDIAGLLSGIRRTLSLYGTLENCLREGLKEDGVSPARALEFFRKELRSDIHPSASGGTLLPDPSKNSACKRLHLFLKWMVRSDEVDPGGWTVLDPSDLLVPLDTHMFSIARALGMTSRKGADFRVVIEVTRAFSTICPEDPLRYDFVLTRFGIRPDLDKKKLLKEGALLLQDGNR
ncbi:MAG: TIGR02757 family protein [Thermovirgaceae bacterium]